MSRSYAVCVGGPFHGALIRLEQRVGVVTVPDPRGGSATEPYRITRDRVWHPCRETPFIVLVWIGKP